MDDPSVEWSKTRKKGMRGMERVWARGNVVESVVRMEHVCGIFVSTRGEVL